MRLFGVFVPLPLHYNVEALCGGREGKTKQDCQGPGYVSTLLWGGRSRNLKLSIDEGRRSRTLRYVGGACVHYDVSVHMLV